MPIRDPQIDREQTGPGGPSTQSGGLPESAGSATGFPPTPQSEPMGGATAGPAGPGIVPGGSGESGGGAPQDTNSNNDANTLPPDLVGDIPPPPIPGLPAMTRGSGVAGMRGTEAGTFARPGTAAAAPFRSAAFVPKRPARFGPGVAMAGGGSTAVQGLDMATPGLNGDDAAELLARLARGGGF